MSGKMCSPDSVPAAPVVGRDALLRPPPAVAPVVRPSAATGPAIKAITDFIQHYAATLLAAGSQTARVERTVARIAKAWGYGVELAIFSHHFMLSVVLLAPNGQTVERRTAVCSFVSEFPSFQRVAALNALSWRIADEMLPLELAREIYDAICAVPRISPQMLRCLVPAATAALCYRFGGTPLTMLLVFCATYVGYALRQRCTAWGMDVKVIFALCAFVASMLTAPAVIFHWDDTAQIGMASSVLFLTPGLPLINAVLDLLDGHALLGVARIIQATTLLICIALGLSLTMLLMGVGTL